MADTDIALWPVLDALKTALATGSSKLVEIGRAPDGVAVDERTGLVTQGYFILYGPIASSNSGGLASGDQMVDLLLQITAVGRDERQAIQLLDRARTVVRTSPLTPTGLRVISTTLEEAAPPQTEGNVVSAAQRVSFAVEAA